MNNFLKTFFTLLLPVLFIGCDTEKEELQSDPLSDWKPLEIGKFIIYRVDSMVFTRLGTQTEIHRYRERHTIESQITDNLGRPTYRVIRSQTDSMGTQPWRTVGNYLITPLTDRMEVIENNIRTVDLHMPMSTGFTWRPNYYVNDNPYQSLYNFDPSPGDIREWQFQYGNVRKDTIGGRILEEVRPVNLLLTDVYLENATDTGPINANELAINIVALDKYAKNIGLVYRKRILWQHRPEPDPHTLGFGITMWMIDHN